MFDSNPEMTFGYVADRLNRYVLAYLHVIEPRVKGIETIGEGQPPVASALLRQIYKGNILAAGGFDPESAELIIERGDADMVAFGRYFISNPDLPRRIQLGLPLNIYDRATFYNNDARGYTDYPFYYKPIYRLKTGPESAPRGRRTWQRYCAFSTMTPPPAIHRNTQGMTSLKSKSIRTARPFPIQSTLISFRGASRFRLRRVGPTKLSRGSWTYLHCYFR